MDTRVLTLSVKNGIPIIPDTEYTSQQVYFYTAHGPLLIQGKYRYHPTVLVIYPTTVANLHVLCGPGEALDKVGQGPPFEKWANFGNWVHWRCNGSVKGVPFVGRHVNTIVPKNNPPSKGNPWVLGEMIIDSTVSLEKVLPNGKSIKNEPEDIRTRARVVQ